MKELVTQNTTSFDISDGNWHGIPINSTLSNTGKYVADYKASSDHPSKLNVCITLMSLTSGNTYQVQVCGGASLTGGTMLPDWGKYKTWVADGTMCQLSFDDFITTLDYMGVRIKSDVISGDTALNATISIFAEVSDANSRIEVHGQTNKRILTS